MRWLSLDNLWLVLLLFFRFFSAKLVDFYTCYRRTCKFLCLPPISLHTLSAQAKLEGGNSVTNSAFDRELPLIEVHGILTSFVLFPGHLILSQLFQVLVLQLRRFKLDVDFFAAHGCTVAHLVGQACVNVTRLRSSALSHSALLFIFFSSRASSTLVHLT